MHSGKYHDFMAIWMPERFKEPLQSEYNFVPGSRMAYISIVGDIMGNNFVEDVLNPGNTIGLDYHSGEGVLYT